MLYCIVLYIYATIVRVGYIAYLLNQPNHRFIIFKALHNIKVSRKTKKHVCISLCIQLGDILIYMYMQKLLSKRRNEQQINSIASYVTALTGDSG